MSRWSCCFLHKSWSVLFILFVLCILRERANSRARPPSHFETSAVNCKYSSSVVTAYFTFSKSKHNHAEYMRWFGNFFPYLSTPLFIFTERNMLDYFSSIRSQFRNLTTIILFESIWQIPVAKEFEAVFRSQWTIDPERRIHSPELYAIWNCKSWFLKTAAERNDFSSDFFFWVDAGSFRDRKVSRDWPDTQRVQAVFVNTSNRFLVSAINSAFWNDIQRKRINPNYPFDKFDIIQGTFFGGTVSSVPLYHEHFLQLLRNFSLRNLFIGKDQNVMNSFVLQYPQYFIILDSSNLDHSCGNGWFYFQFFLSSLSVPAGCRTHRLRLLSGPDSCINIRT